MRRLILACLVLAGAVTGVRGQLDGFERDYRASRSMIYFPPVPPPLDRPVSRAVQAGSSRGVAPAILAPFVCEYFYPQLASRLQGGAVLPDKLRQELDAYTSAKLTLLRELRAELEKVQPLDAAARQTALEALARRQASQLAQLEKSADQLRRDLHESEHGWGDLRDWHLGDDPRRGYSPSEVAQVMRAYAYYQNNLLPAQRGLLLEIAIELSAAVDNAAKAASTQPYFFFSPDPARIMVPNDVSADVATLLAAYQTKKSALKKQLYDAVYEFDGLSMTLFRNPIRTATEKQTGPLAELETMAEDIRRRMAGQAITKRPGEKSPLSAALTARFHLLLQQRITAQRDAAAKADALVARHRGEPVRVNYRFEEESLKFIVSPARGFRGGPLTDADKQIVDSVSGEFSTVAEEFAQRMADLMTERDAIRKEAGQFLGTTNNTTIDNAFTVMARIFQRESSSLANDEYRAAVFEPGLSVPQRRLLLDAAIQRLDMPLPRGEMQPTRRGNSW